MCILADSAAIGLSSRPACAGQCRSSRPTTARLRRLVSAWRLAAKKKGNPAQMEGPAPLRRRPGTRSGSCAAGASARDHGGAGAGRVISGSLTRGGRPPAAAGAQTGLAQLEGRGSGQTGHCSQLESDRAGGHATETGVASTRRRIRSSRTSDRVPNRRGWRIPAYLVRPSISSRFSQPSGISIDRRADLKTLISLGPPCCE